ncbi:MAG: hypothetical protein IPM69_04940 [Ignavibacteria bacterium]|nr:hypothetical protein [Ignavibacteria bacterium]
MKSFLIAFGACFLLLSSYVLAQAPIVLSSAHCGSISSGCNCQSIRVRMAQATCLAYPAGQLRLYWRKRSNDQWSAAIPETSRAGYCVTFNLSFTDAVEVKIGTTVNGLFSTMTAPCSNCCVASCP